ncbi:uncharacterized protein [Littorina saxatilis]|uniref:C2H2-type domain-containing protein n=1 Tax=Littorina saxatilis TaxID=31220 RepID=A0AAN9C0D2_9CAEN
MDRRRGGTGTSNNDTGYGYVSPSNPSGYDAVRDLSTLSHLSRTQCPSQQPLSPGNPFEQADGGATSTALSAELERRYAGQHPLLHGSNFAYAMGNLPTSLPSLDRLGFPDALDYTRFGVRPSASQSGLGVSRYGLERADAYEFDRGQVSGLMGQGHALFSTGQAAGSLQMPGYNANKDGGTYFGVTSHVSVEENMARGSSVDINHFDRGRLSVSPHGNRRSAYNDGSHLNHPRDNFPGGSAPERSPFFVSRQRSSPHVSSSQACPDILENYSQRQATMLAESRSHVDSAGRYQSHYSTSVPSYIPLGGASNYVYCNSPMVSSVRSFNPTLPHSTYNPGSPFDCVPSPELQFNAPPPAHSAPPAHAHIPDAVLQRCGFTDSEKKQLAERNLYDANFLHLQSHGVQNRNNSYDHGGTINSHRENDLVSPPGDARAMKSPTHSEEESQMSTEIENASGRLAENKIMLNNEVFEGERACGQNEPTSQTARHYLEAKTFSQVTRHAESSKEDALFSASNETIARDASFSSIISNSDRAGEQFPFQQKTERELLENPDRSFPSNTGAGSFMQEKVLAASQREGCQTPPARKVQSTPFTVTPSMYSESSDGEEDTEPEEQPVVEKSLEYTAGLNLEAVLPELDNKTGAPKLSTHNINVQSADNTRLESATVKEEPEHYDSSTSEYEPPSPREAPAKYPTQASLKQKKRKHHCRTSFIEESGDGVEGDKPPRIRLIIRKERPKKTSRVKNEATKQSNTKVTQNLGSKVGKTSGITKGKKGNKTCPICQKTFSRADSLTCHMRVHTGDRPYVCEYCSTSYKVSSHLRDHVRSKHTNTTPYECEKCNKTFTYNTAKRRHEKICGKDLSERVEFVCAKCEKGFVTAKGYEKHQMKCNESRTVVSGVKDEDMPFICITCEKRYDTFPGLDRHQRFFCGRSPQKGRYECEECGKVFLKRNRYITHTRRHVGDKPFKCTQCDACFYDSRTLRRHVVHHNGGNKKFKCSLCDAAYYMKHCLSLHVMRVHCGMKPYKCNECELDFSSGYKLSRHIRRVHRKERRFKCMLCSNRFFDSSGWMTHMRMHALPPNKPGRGRTVKQHTCKLCQKSFFKKDLQVHVASEHPGATLHQALGKQLAKCDICFKDFSCQDSLRVHRLRHSGLRPFKCDQCNKSFMLKSALVLHQRRHTDFRPHGCPKCGEMFRWKASVTQHMLHHHPLPEGENDVKKFTCHKCGKMFKQQICLNVHMKRHWDVMPHICCDCGKGFVELSRLKIHMSKHDGPKPFMCENCGAGFFYKYLLDDHIRKKHTATPRQSWLCEECGKSLSRKDSLLHHMALHAKYPGGKIPQKGRRKGSKYPQKFPRLVQPKSSMDGMHSTPGQSREGMESSESGLLRSDASTNVGPLTDWRPAENVTDLPVGTAEQPRLTMPAEEMSPYQFSTYIHHTIPWPQPEGH